ncbi:MAG TPA: LysM peptidoglycan-binding domain-containing protein [Saprospiraceae bacterium]|nr:LysM peptidoglycan-binding domain-containing protein [Saprospiraceae bacterium]
MQKSFLHRLIISVFLLGLALSGKATGDSTRYLLPTDTLRLSISSFGEKLIEHYFEKGQTLFSLSKFYGLTVEELKYYNPGLMNGVKIGDKVEIPIPNRAIIRYPDATFDYTSHVPLYYTIEKGDTYYGLSKRIFKLPIEEIQRRLLPKDEQLSVGQRFFVGWMAVTGVPESYRLVRGHPLFRKNQELRPLYLNQANNKELNVVAGAATALQNSQNQSSFLVLFDGVPEGRYVEIFYPMRNRRVLAKVVGKIPASLYEPNIRLVVSPLTAKLLGAKDDEFYVKIFYY